MKYELIIDYQNITLQYDQIPTCITSTHYISKHNQTDWFIWIYECSVSFSTQFTIIMAIEKSCVYDELVVWRRNSLSWIYMYYIIIYI